MNELTRYTPSEIAKVDRLTACIVLRRVEPSSFEAALLALCLTADRHNLAKIWLTYPAMATAVDIFKRDPNGLETLTQIAEAQK